MNLSHLGGILFGLIFLALAFGLAADNPSAFVNLPGLLIVIGGTFTAIFISFPMRDAIGALKQAKVLTEKLDHDMEQDVTTLVAFSKLWFRNQLHQIDEKIETIDDSFMARGLQMVRDRQSYEDTMAIMNWKIAQYRSRETEVINIFRSMATFAPAFGMVGSLVGLVNMLQGVEGAILASMTADMAIALITTFYGLLLSNLVFKPIATKLEQRRNLRVMHLSMISEGIAMLHQKRTPSVVYDTLSNFVNDAKQEEPATKAPLDKGLTSKLGMKPV